MTKIKDGNSRLVVIPKSRPVRSKAYRRRVAAMDCIHCGRAGPSQCAHADEGKGMGIKASDWTCFPLCADRPGEHGCHWLFGTSGQIPREERRAMEAEYGALTRARMERE